MNNLFDDHPDIALGLGDDLHDRYPNNNDPFSEMIGNNHFLSNLQGGYFDCTTNSSLIPPLATNNYPMNQISSFFSYKCRNSFDFLEMESQNLLEMTGDNYKQLVNN